MKELKLNRLQNEVANKIGLAKLKSSELNIAVVSKAEEHDLWLVNIQSKANPNKENIEIILDENGVEQNKTDLLKKHGLDVFLPKPVVLDHIFAIKKPTITPNVNNLILNLCDRFGEILNVHIPVKPIRNVDIYFLCDTTGSMGGYINTIKANIANVINSLPSGYNFGFGVGNYKDFKTDPYCFKNDLPITVGNNPAVISAVNTWSASGGYDGCEGQFFALDQIASLSSIGWRSNSEKIIVWIGDAPAHDPICGSISGLSYDINEVSLKAKLKLASIKVLALNCGYHTLDGLPAAAGFGDYVTLGCNQTTVMPSGGQATRIANPPIDGAVINSVTTLNIANAIVNIINSSLSVISNVNLVPTGNIANFICSINPAGGYNNLNTNVAHNLEFVVCFKGKTPCKEKDQVFTGTFDVVADGVVIAQKKVRILVPACKSKGKCACGCC